VLRVLQRVQNSRERMAEFVQILERLKNQRDELVASLKRIDSAINLIEKALSILEPADVGKFISEVGESLKDPPQRQRVRSALPPGDVAAAAREILIEIGRPLTRSQLVAALEERGIPLVGKDRNKNLGTILWRHRHQFVQIPKLGYWLADQALAGIYNPEEWLRNRAR
jgi:hypothetical protein